MSQAVIAGQVLEERVPAARLSLYVWIGITTIAFFLVGLILAAPLAAARGNLSVASSIYYFFGYLCHQIPERSFQIAGRQFAVCSRCSGLYAGFAIAALFYPLVRSLTNTETPSRVWLILAALPLAIDFGLGYFNIWHNTHASRFATGALLSSVAVFYIVPGAIELTSTLSQKFRANAPIDR
jgi:uncharacterized membrane protein